MIWRLVFIHYQFPKTLKYKYNGSERMSENIHENCENYSPKKDYCLKFFEENVSEKYKVCKEYSEFNDKELSRKWSN